VDGEKGLRGLVVVVGVAKLAEPLEVVGAGDLVVDEGGEGVARVDLDGEEGLDGEGLVGGEFCGDDASGGVDGGDEVVLVGG